MNDFLNHVRSLEDLHGLIEKDLTSGTKEATNRLIGDVKAATE